MAASFPTAVVTSLKEAVNNLSCDLTADVLIGDATINVTSTTGAPSVGSFHIENEVIYYTGKTAASFTGCTRGQDGTSAAGHLKVLGGEVIFGPEAHHINQLNEEMVAVQTDLGITGAKTYIPKSLVDAKGDLFVGTANDTVARIAVGTDGQVVMADSTQASGVKWGSASAFWADMPGTPTRVGDTSFTITDTGNALKYDLLFKKGTIIRWLENTTFQWAMVISASYGSPNVTITMVGDSLTAGFTSMKFCMVKAHIETFIIAGVLSALTDTAKTWITPYPICVFSADLNVKVAGTGAGANTVDINDDATTMFTTKPSIAENVTADIDNVSDNVETVVAAGSLITIDVDAITATTAPTDAYVKVYYALESWRYQS